VASVLPRITSNTPPQHGDKQLSMSTHQALSALITRNKAVDESTNRLSQFLVQRSVPNVARLTTAFTGPAAVDLAVVPGLLITNSVGFNGGAAVVGGRTYSFRAYLPCTINGTSGGTIDWSGGTATISAFQATGLNHITATAPNLLKTTTLAGLTMNAAAAYTLSVVEGVFTASSSGSFGPRLATFTGTATAPILGAGAYLELTEIAS